MGREARVPREKPKSVKRVRPSFYVKRFPVKLQHAPGRAVKELVEEK